MPRHMLYQISGHEVNRELRDWVERTAGLTDEQEHKALEELKNTDLKRHRRISYSFQVCAILEAEGRDIMDIRFVRNAIFWSDNKCDITFDIDKVRKEVQQRQSEQNRKRLVALGLLGMLLKEGLEKPEPVQNAVPKEKDAC